MAKIRALKPEFFTDESVVELSPLARLLFQGMWIHACDNGHLKDRPKQLKLRILPADDCDVDALLHEVVHHGMAQRVDGWLVIPTLGIHQKPDKRYFLRCDFPGCRDERKPLSTRREAPPEPDEYPPDPLSDHDVDPTGPHGDHAVATRFPSTDGDGDGDGDGDEKRCASDADAPFALLPPEENRPPVDAFEAFWKRWPNSKNKKTARTAFIKATKLTTADVLITAIAPLVAEYERKGWDIPMAASWLNAERWNDEYGTASGDATPVDPMLTADGRYRDIPAHPTNPERWEDETA